MVWGGGEKAGEARAASRYPVISGRHGGALASSLFLRELERTRLAWKREIGNEREIEISTVGFR